MKTRNILLKIISITMVFVCIVCASSVTSSALSSYDYVKNNTTYYIKNVHSGKYLDVYNDNTYDGANVVQKNFDGSSSQQWRITITSAGTCRLKSAQSGKYLTVYNNGTTNNTNIEIRSENSTGSQMFWIAPNSDDYSARITSFSSSYNKCVVIYNASLNENASAILYTYNGSKNDQWVFEPVSGVVPANGKNYAYQFFDSYSTTYPNVHYLGGDCANFTSQCMVTSGIHYQNSWYVYKLNEAYLTPTTTAQLNTSWSLGDLNGRGSPWISAPRFQDYWTEHSLAAYIYTSSEILNYRDEVFDLDIVMGDAIQIASLDGVANHTMYISGYNTYEGETNFAVSYHSSSTYQKNICQLAQQDVSSGIEMFYIFYKLF